QEAHRATVAAITGEIGVSHQCTTLEYSAAPAVIPKVSTCECMGQCTSTPNCRRRVTSRIANARVSKPPKQNRNKLTNYAGSGRRGRGVESLGHTAGEECFASSDGCVAHSFCH